MTRRVSNKSCPFRVKGLLFSDHTFLPDPQIMRFSTVGRGNNMSSHHPTAGRFHHMTTSAAAGGYGGGQHCHQHPMTAAYGSVGPLGPLPAPPNDLNSIYFHSHPHHYPLPHSLSGICLYPCLYSLYFFRVI